jgi:ferredoxin
VVSIPDGEVEEEVSIIINAQYTSSQAGHDGACSWNPMCINCGACVIVYPVEAIFNTADLPE